MKGEGRLVSSYTHQQPIGAVPYKMGDIIGAHRYCSTTLHIAGASNNPM
ncbi:MAG: hypothetical protein IPN22_14400 [Bacteroidetes bacterium]|nr:hypothetical protein [Bacteroidota bacterium]